MLEIIEYDVYGSEKAMRYSGFPKSVDISRQNILSEKDFNRCEKLGNADTGSGHDCFLKGITVTFVVRYPLYWSTQFQRYHFMDIISSQSKMHSILKFDIKKQCNEHVTPKAIENLNECIDQYNKDNSKENYMKIISNVPAGFEMSMAVTTNYLQLKTIYNQRHKHRLDDWIIFCGWIENLPKFKSLCLKGV